MPTSCQCRGQHSEVIHIPSLMQQTPPAQPSFYRRQLPSPPATDFASEEGKVIFTEALASGTMACFFPLIAQFQTQAEPAYCGLASLSVALNALSIDPGRTWKGPWRWFDEALLDCCEPLEEIKREGIVISKVACLARCNGAAVRSVLASNGSEEAFREDVRRTSEEGRSNIIVGYSRKVLLQTGDGHFSPIGGYHAARDLVLILDVARFKYPPHWVPLPLLWQAMQQTDKVTGQSRGYLLLSPRGQPSAALFTLARPDSQWWAVAKYASTDVREILQRTDCSTAECALAGVLEGLQNDVTNLLTWICTVAPAGEDASFVPNENSLVQSVKVEVLRQLRALKVHAMVSKWAAEKPEETLDTRNGLEIRDADVPLVMEGRQEQEADTTRRTLRGATRGSPSLAGADGQSRRVKVDWHQKVAALRNLVSVLLSCPVLALAQAALEVKRDVGGSGKAPSLEKVEQLSSWLAEQCMRVAPASKAEIFEQLKERLKRSKAVSRKLQDVLSWLDNKFVEPSSAYHFIPGTSQLAAIRKRQSFEDTTSSKRNRSEPSGAEALDGPNACKEETLIQTNASRSDLPEGRVQRTTPQPLCCSSDSYLEETSLHEAVDGPTRVDLLTVFLLLCPSEVWASARDPSVREELQLLTNACCLPSTLHGEMLYLKEQFAALQTEAPKMMVTGDP